MFSFFKDLIQSYKEVVASENVIKDVDNTGGSIKQVSVGGRGINMSGNNMIINGKRYDNIQGNNVCINGGQIIVDGKVICDDNTGEVVIKWEGDVANLDCSNADIYGNVTGDVDGTNIDINGDVGGSVDGTNITCGKVNGNVKGMNITHG